MADERPVQLVRHVLVVEDDFELADVLTEVLTHENCVSEHASNGMEALGKMGVADFDAIICDLMMPRVDGQAFYTQVARNYPYLADRFLFITGHAARRAGLSDFILRTGNALLEKPFTVEQLREALKELFERDH
jgi:two-component system, cell cycle sensor histidine kinase and response regulator CckA